MNLYFLDKDDKQHLVAKDVTEKDAIPKMLIDLDNRYPDFRNYYPARKKADEYVRNQFIALGGKPALAHPYSFALMDCEYLRNWFSGGESSCLILTISRMTRSALQSVTAVHRS